MTTVGQARSEDTLPKRLAARFELTRHVSDGWLTRTWEVIEKTTGERRALKLLHPHLSSNTTRTGRTARVLEAYRASVAVRHSAFASAFDLGPIAVEGGVSAFLLTEFIEGDSLKTLVSENTLSIAATAQVLLQLVEALDEASPHGPHLGLCPRNIFIQTAPTARVRVTDHGLLLALHRDVPALAIECPERSAWLSPEQLSGRHSGAQTDMWSIGSLLRFAITGMNPATPLEPNTLPKSVKRLVDWLTHPDPDCRPDGFQILRKQLEVLVASDETHTPTLRLGPDSRARTEKLNPNLVWGALAVMATAIAVFALSS